MELENIVIPLIAFQMQLKIYHWQTTEYARHIASDGLGIDLAAKIDAFVESIQGSRGKRVRLAHGLIKLENITDASAQGLLLSFKRWLSNDLSKLLDKTETDLINMRDDMLSVVDKTLYLFTLK